MFKTESEAWEAIADTLEMIEEMPPIHELQDITPSGQAVYGYRKAAGLCEVIVALSGDLMITLNLRRKMLSRIAALTDRRNRRFLFKRGKWRPRVELARRFAAESQPAEGRRV